MTPDVTDVHGDYDISVTTVSERVYERVFPRLLGPCSPSQTSQRLGRDK